MVCTHLSKKTSLIISRCLQLLFFIWAFFVWNTLYIRLMGSIVIIGYNRMLNVMRRERKSSEVGDIKLLHRHLPAILISLASVQVLFKHDVFPKSGTPLNKQYQHDLRPPKIFIWYLYRDLFEYVLYIESKFKTMLLHIILSIIYIHDLFFHIYAV